MNQNSNSDLIVVSKDGNAVTTSLTIADGTNVKHRNVIELIRKYSDDLECFGRVPFKTETFETAGGPQSRNVAFLNERQATLLLTLMRNNDVVKEFKKRLVKAFFELAEQQRFGGFDVPKTYIAALECAARIEKERAQLASKVEKDAPKVAFHDEVVASHDMVTVSAAAKAIGTGRNRLLEFMRDIGWLMWNNEPYQDKIEQGLLGFKVHEDKRITPLVTGKGLSKLHAFWYPMLPTSNETFNSVGF